MLRRLASGMPIRASFKTKPAASAAAGFQDREKFFEAYAVAHATQTYCDAVIPRRCAAPRARSSRAPILYAMPQGPVSLIRTVIERPFLGLVTVSVVPIGQVRAAAVLPFGSKRSPFAVRFPDE